MKTWRLIKTIEDRGAMQMAIDEAIFLARIKNKVPNTLRFYKWKPACVTIGFFQNLEEEIDIKKIQELNIDITRRYTGGGAVFHENELTYSLAISEKEISGDIVDSYKKICSAIIEGLNLLKIKTVFKPINDLLTVEGKKISGNAQTRKDGVILQHGTILLDLDVRKMFSVLKVPDEKIKDKLIKSVEERVTSLEKELGRKILFEELEKILIKGFESCFEVRIVEEELTKEELAEAERLFKEKYSNDEWINWK
jgi:lipoate-protein ligase A